MQHFEPSKLLLEFQRTEIQTKNIYNIEHSSEFRFWKLVERESNSAQDDNFILLQNP